MRMLHHLETEKDAVFLTLTYDEKHVVRRGNGTALLVPADLQKFFKRLRINRYRRGKSTDLSYYACGEYGDRTQRSHYHAIVYGLGYNVSDRADVEYAWGQGNIDYGLVTPASIRYVAGYIDKKIMGAKAAYEGRVDEFQLCSHGLGEAWIRQNAVKVMYDGALKFQGTLSPIGAYYSSKLKELWPAEWLGTEERIFRQSQAAEAELYSELIPEFGGASYDQLGQRERDMLAATMYARNKVLAVEMEQKLAMLRQIKEKV